MNIFLPSGAVEVQELNCALQIGKREDLKMWDTMIQDKTFIVCATKQDYKGRYLKHTFCRPGDFGGVT